MTHKMEDMTDEIARLREDIQNMQDDTFTNRLKRSLSEAADRLEKRCEKKPDSEGRIIRNGGTLFFSCDISKIAIKICSS